MRIDLFLKLSRLCQRRTVAQELCDAGLVKLNGHPVKSAHSIKPGDIIVSLNEQKLATLDRRRASPHYPPQLAGVTAARRIPPRGPRIRRSPTLRSRRNARVCSSHSPPSAGRPDESGLLTRLATYRSVSALPTTASTDQSGYHTAQ